MILLQPETGCRIYGCICQSVDSALYVCLALGRREWGGGGGLGGQISDTAPVRTDATNALFFTTCHEHQSTLGTAGILRHPILDEGLHCHEQQPPLETTHKGVNQRSKDVTQTQQQKPESPAVTLAWHASKYEAHKPHHTSEAQAFRDTGISNAGISRHRNLERRHFETPESRMQALRDTRISNAGILKHPNLQRSCSRHRNLERRHFETPEFQTQAFRDTGISNAGISRHPNFERRHSETPESRPQAFRDIGISNVGISRHPNLERRHFETPKSRTQAFLDT